MSFPLGTRSAAGQAVENAKAEVERLDRDLGELRLRRNDLIARAGDKPSSEQQRAIDTIDAAVAGLETEAGSAKRAWERAIADLQGNAGPGDRSKPSAPMVGELRSYGRGESVQAAARDEGVTLGGVIRGLATGDWSSVPADRRTLLSGGAAAAVPGYQTLGIVDLARQSSRIFNAGARVLPMDAPSVKVARVESIPDVELAPEAVDRDLTDGAFVFASEEMDAFSAWLYTTLSVEAIEDCRNLNEVVTSNFARQLALAFDKYALAGTGTAQPLGLANMTAAGNGVSELLTIGELTSYAPFVQAVGAVRSKFHEPGAVIMPNDTWLSLALLTDTTGQPLNPPRAYAALQEYVSELLPSNGGVGTNEQTAVVGDWSKLVVGVRTDLTIEVSRTGAGFKKGMVEVRGYMRFGSFVEDPGAFAICKGILSPA